jgi:hypothetical protein
VITVLSRSRGARRPVIAAGGSYRSLVLAKSPLVYWRLGDLSGTTAADASGNSLTGTYTGGYTLGATGINGGGGDEAVALDGTGYVQGGGSVSVTTFTVHAWIYRTASGAATIGAQGNAGATLLTYYFRVGANSGFTSAAATYVEVTSPDPSLNAWHHVALTYDGASLKTYLDGSPFSSASASGTPSAISSHVVAGRLGDASVHYVTGVLDEFAVHGTALSDADIAAFYTAGA